MIYEEFVNKPCKNAFIGFLVLYGIGTYLPHLISIIKTDMKNYNTHRNHKPIVSILSLFQMHYLYTIFVMGPPSGDSNIFKVTFTTRSII